MGCGDLFDGSNLVMCNPKAWRRTRRAGNFLNHLPDLLRWNQQRFTNRPPGEQKTVGLATEGFRPWKEIDAALGTWKEECSSGHADLFKTISITLIACGLIFKGSIEYLSMITVCSAIDHRRKPLKIRLLRYMGEISFEISSFKERHGLWILRWHMHTLLILPKD